MIRRATMADIPGIVQLGCSLYYESEYAKRFGYFDTTKAMTSLARVIADKDSLVLVSERNGVIGGFVAAGVFESAFATKDYVSDHVLIARDGSGFALLRRVVRFARERGLPLVMGTSFGYEGGRANDLYERVGLARVGSLYMG